MGVPVPRSDPARPEAGTARPPIGPPPSGAAGRGPDAEEAAGRAGLTMLDVAAMVIGAAVASIHIRSAIPRGLPGGGWVLIWATFAGITLTAAGPFLMLGRRFGRPLAGYPRPGDRLWTLLGSPWVLAALVRAASTPGRARPDDPTALTLAVGLGLASLVALAVVWKTWVMVPPGRLALEGPSSWTERIGLGLAVAWPVQCGFGLIVIDGSS